MKACLVLLAWLPLLLLSGCSTEKMAQIGRTEDACFPGKPGGHIVEVDRVKFADTDLHNWESGDPLPVRIYLIEDGTELDPAGGGTLSGRRGERDLEIPLRWKVDFKPDSRYQIVVEEQGDHPQAGHWEFPPEGRPGFWPVPANKGTFRIGRTSFVHFTDELVAAE